ncbi:Asp23/Gls24 family envelope stress response protein [Streptomyces niveiscabiei]|uniref:Asp23/Gls24 family envelope stress response protein n=1 Tax=Streptomyces niveiscabiei TaxID=164115 RepID=UPI0029AEEA92|nr:Asp23/Gls24 family envelope stress response protein [Streptomyces niveiscabiei]MDX3386413.1 Asp23/Gls24 family envelope stress response protein [Streptomyces niveiscabiei]
MTDRTDPPYGTSAQEDDDELLPCGRLLSRAWADWETQADDTHARTCPHCRHAVRGLDELESAVRGLRTETADTGSYDAEPLTRRIMDVVRLELRPGRPLPLGDPSEDLWIMEAVAARALRAAAETVPGVHAGSCRLLDGHADGTVEVRLDIHAPTGVPLPDLTARVREQVGQAADRALGMAIAAVHIRVTDLLPLTADDDREGRTP